MRTHGQVRVKGFTLIELLVVISIIALLLSVIVPSLSKAKEQAKFIICRNKLRTVGLMVGLYAFDNDEKIKGHPDYWMEALRPYYGYDGDNWAAFNEGYKEPFRCATATRTNPAKDPSRTRSYACNRNIVVGTLTRDGQDAWAPDNGKNIRKITQPARPSATMFAVDAGYFIQDGEGGTGRYFGCVDGNMWYTSGFYHHGKTWTDLEVSDGSKAYTDGSLNIVYFDASVSLKKFKDFPFDENLLRPEIADLWDETSSNGYRMFWYGRP